jgi:hypothetical protein
LALAVSGLPITVGGLIWLSVPAAALQLILSRPAATQSSSMLGFQIALIPFFAVGFAMVLAPAFRFVAARHTEYRITGRRVMRSVRLVGHRVTLLELRQVVLTKLVINLVDQRLGTGSLILYAVDPRANRRRADIVRADLLGIPDPIDVARLVNQFIQSGPPDR